MNKLSRDLLPYGRQWIDEEDIAAVVDVLRGDWLTTGPAVAVFEQRFAAKLDVPHAVSCANGTAALHLAAMSLRLGADDSVIVPSLTFAATATAIRLTGAEVVFADVDPDNGLMTPATLEAALDRANGEGQRPTAVFPVHLNGYVCDMPTIGQIAEAHDAEVVEDACHAIGGPGVGQCTYSAMAVFSFHPVKTITSGEGGMVTTRHQGLASDLVRFRNHGITRDAGEFTDLAAGFDDDGAPHPWYYEISEIGLNYRLTDIHAALGASQLAKLDAFAARRQYIRSLYDTRIGALAPGLRPATPPSGPDPVLHLYTVLCNFDAIGKTRAEVMRELSARGVGTQVHYVPVHRQPYYVKRYGCAELPGVDRYYARQLSLPLFPAMEDGDVDRVIDALSEVCGAER